MELNIYTSSGILKTTCEPADSDIGVKEIMADNVINLSFILFENIKLEVNDYVDFYGERYYCLEEYFPTQKSTVEWEYRCQFFGIEGLIRRALCLNNADGAMEADFSLTDTPENHLRLIVGNINRVLNTTIWEMGECIIGENITLEYSGVYCSDALNNLAQKCETEWWFDGLRLNLSRCEIGNNIELGYPVLLSLSRQAADNVKFFTRLFPLGSKRNIVPDQYGASRLQLPEGIKYLEQNTQYGIIEHFESAAFEKIYPRRVGTISSVRSETKTGADGKPFTIYYFVDKDLNFDPNSYEIAGLVKNIYFDSGELNGRDFEVNFNSTTKEFEIINQYPDENTQLPGGGLVPKVGNKYILYNITMPVEYYALAETEYKEAVLAYMAKNNKDKAVYKAPTDYIELDERGVRLLLGQRVKLISEKYFPQTGYKLSRITRISRKLNNPNEAEIEISDVLGTGKITMITNEITKTTEVVKGVDKRTEVSARKQSKALQELENYLLNTDGYFDTDKFKALSIEARMLAVGLQSQNFTLSGIRVTPNSGNLTTVVVTAGTLIHASLEILGLGSTWAITGKTLSAPDVNKAYYIYAKCSKNTLSGTIEISETELKVEHFPNYYVFNLGVLYPQRSGESWRDYSATYGVTSVVGDQIYGGGIKALDGFNFVDLRAAAENGRFRLGSRSKGSIDYGVTEPDTLTMLNTKLVSRGGNSAYAPVYRGAWTNAELYYVGETVTYNGSMYQCKVDIPTAGIMPLNAVYWDKTVSKGDTGAVDEETLNNINNKIDGIQIGGVNLILNSKHIELAGTYHNSAVLLFSKPLTTGKNYILSVSNMVDGLYFRIYPAGGGWETGVNVPFNTTFTVHGEFAHGIFYAGVDGIIATAKFEMGNKATDWTPAPEDINTAIADAKAAGTAAQTSANTANTNVNALKNFTDSAFADGIIDRAESVAIEKYKNTVDESFNDLQQTYAVVYNNTYLEVGIASNNLHAAMTGLTTCKNNLLTAITAAITDGITTAAEKEDVDIKYTAYNQAVGTFKTALEQANSAIQVKLDTLSTQKVDNVKIGTRNYIAKQYLLDWNKTKVEITRIGKDLDGIYYAINNGFLYTYIGIQTTQDIFQDKIKYKPNTQYTLSVKWKLPAIQDHVGLILYIYYSDGTNTGITIDKTQTTVITQSVTTAPGKTLTRITAIYGGGLSTYIYDIQLTEGNKVVDFMQAQEDIVTDAVNLLPNSNFAQGITGYTPNQAVALTIQNDYLHATSSQTSGTPGVRFPRIYLDAGINTFKIKLSRINITSYSFPVFTGDLSGVVDTATIETVEGWSDYTVKYTIPTAGEYIIIVMWDASSDYATGIDIKNSFLAKGDVNIQNYSLAPSDVETAYKQYAEAQKQLAEVRAAAYADGIVTAEEQRAIQDATNKANYAREAAIQAAKEFDDAMQIGGINLIPFSKMDVVDKWISNSCSFSLLDGYINITSSAAYSYIVSPLLTKQVDKNTIVTLSFEYRCTNNNYIDLKVTPNGNSAVAVVYIRFSHWTKHVVTFKPVDAIVGETLDRIYFEFYPTPDNLTVGVSIKNIKLEIGNKATDWSPTPEDTIAQAVEDSAKNLGLTKIDGGLIWTNLVKLQRIGGTETAGISGIDKNSQGQTLPAFWAGGTYSQALNRQANVDIYHNGKAKLGRLFVNEDGSTVYKDTSSVERIYITPESISALSDLTGSSSLESGVNTNSYIKNIILNTFSQDVLLGTVYVSKNSSDLMIKNIAISTSIINNVPLGSAISEVRLYVKRDGAFFAWIDNVGVSYYNKDESPLSPTASKTINTALKVPAGTYQLYAEVSLSTTSDLIDATCYISSGQLTWQYIANISKSEFGQNGILSFRDINNYIYAAIENNLLNFVVKTKGKWDTPGVLAAYSVDSYGNITKRWGGMISESNAYRGSTGSYDVPHQIGHTDYIVTATVAHSGTYTAHVWQKNATSVRITIRGIDDSWCNVGFDLIIVGRNVV